VLKAALVSAKLDYEERLDAIRRLDERALRLERHTAGPSLDGHVHQERRNSHDYRVHGWERPAGYGAQAC
jgi:uncharacterized protein